MWFWWVVCCCLSYHQRLHVTKNVSLLAPVGSSQKPKRWAKKKKKRQEQVKRRKEKKKIDISSNSCKRTFHQTEIKPSVAAPILGQSCTKVQPNHTERGGGNAPLVLSRHEGELSCPGTAMPPDPFRILKPHQIWEKGNKLFYPLVVESNRTTQYLYPFLCLSAGYCHGSKAALDDGGPGN